MLVCPHVGAGVLARVGTGVLSGAVSSLFLPDLSLAPSALPPLCPSLPETGASVVAPPLTSEPASALAFGVPAGGQHVAGSDLFTQSDDSALTRVLRPLF